MTHCLVDDTMGFQVVKLDQTGRQRPDAGGIVHKQAVVMALATVSRP